MTARLAAGARGPVPLPDGVLPGGAARRCCHGL